MKLAIVLPCYNEEEVIDYSNEILCGVILNLLQNRIVEDVSIVYVDDGSCDKTWERIESLSAQRHINPKITGIKLAKNVGHQNALMAGVKSAYLDGYDAIITIDADLQDDVSCIRNMVELAKQGNDIVFNHADFRLMTRKAVEALMSYSERNLFLRGLVKDIGLPSGYVLYDRKERKAGKSKYPLLSMINFALEGITSFSIRPLRIISFVGVVCIFISVILILYGLYSFIVGKALPGWTSIIVSLWFIGGIIILTMGVIGEYIGKIYKEVKNRPRYFIEKKI